MKKPGSATWLSSTINTESRFGVVLRMSPIRKGSTNSVAFAHRLGESLSAWCWEGSKSSLPSIGVERQNCMPSVGNQCEHPAGCGGKKCSLGIRRLAVTPLEGVEQYQGQD